MRILLLLVIFISFAHAAGKPTKKPLVHKFDAKEDLKEALKFMFQGSYLQFKQPGSWVLFGAGVAAVWPLFNADTKIINKQKPPSTFVKKVGGELSNIFNFPIAPIGAYLWARKTNSLRWKKFAQETLAATYLTLIESSLISRIHIHDRPDSSNLTNFETSFRGDSSFPSGHILGFSVLTFKTFQFFGPLPSILPAFLTFITHKERVASKKHWASDTVASFFLAGIASEGVRAASNYGENHPLYEAIFEYQFRFSFNRYDKDGWMGRIAFNY